MTDPKLNGERANFLMKIVAIGFGLWAGVVGWGINQVMGGITSFISGYQQFSLSNERRITAIEDYNKTQDIRLDALLATVNAHLSDDARRHSEQELDLRNQVDAMKKELKKP